MTSETPTDDPILGTKIDGRYRVERFIGAGTMGAVYEATQLAVGRRVAVKVLNSALKTHDEVRERFHLEAQAIAALNHPNCITLFDFGYSDRLGALYMVIEYLEGRTLQDLIFEGIDAELAFDVARQIADVCAHAHEAGILHRDLKPENVMVVDGPAGEPVVKVLDFGLARIFDAATDDTRLTRQGQLFGTPAYMSPEQCGGALDVTAAVDVYALGISLYEMLTGELPFESNNVAEILVMHARKPAPPLDAPDAPPEVVDLVERMLRKDPERRPSARDVADALRDAERRSPIDERPADDPLATEPTLEPTAGRDRKLVITAILFCCIGVAGAVALLVTVDEQQGPLNRATATPGVEKVVWQPVPRPNSPPEEGPSVESKRRSESLGREAAASTTSRAASLAEPRPAQPAAATSRSPRHRRKVETKPPPDEPTTRSNDTQDKKFRKLEFNY